MTQLQMGESEFNLSNPSINSIVKELSERKVSGSHETRMLPLYPTCCRGGYRAPTRDWMGNAGSEPRGSSLGSM